MDYMKEVIAAHQIGFGIALGILFSAIFCALKSSIEREKRTVYWLGHQSLKNGARLPRSYLPESTLALAWFRGRLDAITDQAVGRKRAHARGVDMHGHVPTRMSAEEAFCDLLAGLPGGSPRDLRIAAERVK